MITNKELQYVEAWANKIPMPGVEYSIQVLNSIKKCLETWKEKYSDKEDLEDKKLLFVPSNEPICPYFSMGLIKTTYKENNMDNENPYYAINTLLAMSDPKKFFDNKEVVIPTQMIILDDNNLKKVSASALEKMRLLTMYKSIVEKYKIDCSINIYSDYETILNDISNELVLK